MNVEAVEDFTPGVFVGMPHPIAKGEGLGIKGAFDLFSWTNPARPLASDVVSRDGSQKDNQGRLKRQGDESQEHAQQVGLAGRPTPSDQPHRQRNDRPHKEASKCVIGGADCTVSTTRAAMNV